MVIFLISNRFPQKPQGASPTLHYSIASGLTCEARLEVLRECSAEACLHALVYGGLSEADKARLVVSGEQTTVVRINADGMGMAASIMQR